MAELVMTALEFTKLSREDKEIEFRELKKRTKTIFPSRILERDIKEHISNVSTPMLNKFFASMLQRVK